MLIFRGVPATGTQGFEQRIHTLRFHRDFRLTFSLTTWKNLTINPNSLKL